MNLVLVFILAFFFTQIHYAQAVPIGPALYSPYLQNSAESGNISSQFTLGDLYERGQGIKQDFAEAAKWYGKAAEGISPSNAKAEEWYRRAAQQGHKQAQDSLGMLLMFGIGVKTNVQEGIFWQDLANKSIPHDTNEYINFLVSTTDWTLTTEQSNTIDRALKVWVPKMEIRKSVSKDSSIEEKASAGDSDAQYQLAKSYENPDAGNVIRAIGEAQSNLGFLYEKGQGVPQDYKKAAELYMKAIRNDNRFSRDAEIYLGKMYEEGRGVEQNSEKAKALYIRAIGSCGYWSALKGETALGMLYLRGQKDWPVNYKQAYYWLNLAVKDRVGPAEQGDASISIEEARRHLAWYNILFIEHRSRIVQKEICINGIP